jgi:putative transposase
MAMIDNQIGICRMIYNLAKETKEYAYVSQKINLSCYDLQKQITDLKKEFLFISNVPSQTLQDVIERLDKAYKSFYKGGGYPKWAKKHKYNSLTFKAVSQVSDYVFKLPKIGNVTIFKDRIIQGELRLATITRCNNKYYISIVTKHKINKQSKANENQVGIDMGISFFATLSNGTQIENPRHFLKAQSKLRIENRSLARKKKGSKSWSIQKKRLTTLHSKISAIRKDFLHKNSSILVNQFGFISVEDLNVKNMIKNHRLAKSITDCGWSMFFDMLEYKSNWNSVKFVKISPKYTSQTCNNCEEIDRLSRISQSKFVCKTCGTKINADINASKNILGKGIALIR